MLVDVRPALVSSVTIPSARIVDTEASTGIACSGQSAAHRAPGPIRKARRRCCEGRRGADMAVCISADRGLARVRAIAAVTYRFGIVGARVGDGGSRVRVARRRHRRVCAQVEGGPFGVARRWRWVCRRAVRASPHQDGRHGQAGMRHHTPCSGHAYAQCNSWAPRICNENGLSRARGPCRRVPAGPPRIRRAGERELRELPTACCPPPRA